VSRLAWMSFGRAASQDHPVLFKARRVRPTAIAALWTERPTEDPVREHEAADQPGTPKCSWFHVTRSGHTNEGRSRHRRRHRRRRCRPVRTVARVHLSSPLQPSSGSVRPAGWTRMEDRSHASATRLPATQKPPSCDARALASSCKLQPSRARTRASR